MPEKFRVQITDRALGDLQGIHKHIGSDSPDNAAKMVARLLDSIDVLDEFPTRHRRAGRSWSTGLPVHVVVEEPYLLYYSVDKSVLLIRVIHIRHGARRQPRRFE